MRKPVKDLLHVCEALSRPRQPLLRVPNDPDQSVGVTRVLLSVDRSQTRLLGFESQPLDLGVPLSHRSSDMSGQPR